MDMENTVHFELHSDMRELDTHDLDVECLDARLELASILPDWKICVSN